MKAISLGASQSRNLKSISLRRVWMMVNIFLRRWSRNITSQLGNTLLTVCCISAAACLLSAMAGDYSLSADFAIVAACAIAPELITLSYDKEEDEL